MPMMPLEPEDVRSGQGPLRGVVRTLRGDRERGAVVFIALVVGLTTQASLAQAQVIEVLPDGAATTYAGPVQTVDGVARAIASPAQKSQAPAPASTRQPAASCTQATVRISTLESRPPSKPAQNRAPQ